MIAKQNIQKGQGMKKKSAVKLPIKPSSRKKVWAKCGNRVVFINKKNGDVELATGFICSYAGGRSHFGIDNVDRVVIYGDAAFNPLADNADDAHEKSCCVNDRHILKQAEAKLLKNPAAVKKWFKGMYSKEIISRIIGLFRDWATDHSKPRGIFRTACS